MRFTMTATVLVVVGICSLVLVGDAAIAASGKGSRTYRGPTPPEWSSNIKAQTPKECQASQQNGEPRHCGCDSPTCNYYNDCCLSVSKITIGTPKKIQSLVEEVRPSCVSGFNFRKIEGDDFLPVYQHVFMWDRCPKTPPEGSDHGIRLKCEGLDRVIDSYIPVFSKEYGFLFKNRYCAQCHGFTDAKAIGWTGSPIYVVCGGTQPKPDQENNLPVVLETNMCSVISRLPKHALRECVRSLKSTCSSGASSEQKYRCKHGGTWYTRCSQRTGIDYRNLDCAKCSNGGKCSPVNRPKPSTQGRFGGVFYNYDIVLNFEDTRKKPKTTKKPQLGSTLQPGKMLNSTIKPNMTQKEHEEQLRRDIMGIIAIIGCILSAISLLALIIVYSITKELRTSNGIMVIIICVCLLLALLTFMISRAFEPIPAGCQIVAMLLHFFYMSTFAWMAVYAFDLLRTFLLQGLSSQTESKRRIGIYSAFGFGLPFVISCLALIFNYVDMGSNQTANAISPRFGNPRCWFNSRWGLIAWMFVPALVSVAFNFVVCGILFRFFCVSYASMSQAIRTKQQLFFICLKITTILGTVWIVQIIAIFVRDGIFLEIAAIVASLQGFFITLSFLLSRRVRTTVQSSLSSGKGKSGASRNSSIRAAGGGGGGGDQNGASKPLVRHSSSTKSSKSYTRSTEI